VSYVSPAHDEPCPGVRPHLIARGGGVVLNCGPIAGINGSRDLPQSAHAAARGAIMALTRQLAAEGAAVGIRVTAICPGLIESPAVTAILADAPQLVMSMVERTCERRPGLPKEVAQARAIPGLRGGQLHQR
jgi:meso-butanediol dehydrogenase/(S,S)-butanediol dehydrogenase/diacetyl reductase